MLSDTLGAIVFQDQVIEVAMAFAGFTAGEAEGLRRAMSRARSEAAMRAYEQKFIEGGMANGASREVAERVYDQIVGFSGFGFPKSHSAAFALLAYQSAWLREHYGPEFLCGLLNEQPMGFYPPDALVHEAQRRDIVVLPPDARRSLAECRVEDGAVRIGLGYVNGVRKQDVKAIVAERERGGPFRSLADLAARCGACRETLERLAWAGACDSLVGGPPAVRRRTALWQLGVTRRGAPARVAQRGRPGAARAAARAGRGAAPARDDAVGAPDRRLRLDQGHDRLAPARADAAGPAGGRPREPRARRAPAMRTRVKVAGLVVARQRPATAKGVTFMLLEDEHGTINLIIPPPIHDKFRLAVRAESLVLAEGKLERREGTTNVVVDQIRRLERPDLPVADVRHIEPSRTWSSEAGAELRAVAPAAHSFGRRG